jgi:hypothetical protein
VQKQKIGVDELKMVHYLCKHESYVTMKQL